MYMYYGKHPKILKQFSLLLSNEMLNIRAGIHKMLFNLADMEDPDLVQSC